MRFLPSDAEGYDQGRLYTNASNELLKRSVDQDVRNGKIDCYDARIAYLTDFIPSPDQMAASLTHSPYTLFGTMEKFAEWARENYREKSSSVGDSKTTSEYGDNLARTVLRLRRSHADISLDAFDADVIRSIVKFWKDRPESLTYANRGSE